MAEDAELRREAATGSIAHDGYVIPHAALLALCLAIAVDVLAGQEAEIRLAATFTTIAITGEILSSDFRIVASILTITYDAWFHVRTDAAVASSTDVTVPAKQLIIGRKVAPNGIAVKPNTVIGAITTPLFQAPTINMVEREKLYIIQFATGAVPAVAIKHLPP